MEKWIDLHTHSLASDGTMTPREVVAEAKKNGLSAIALTDHDTTAGLLQARDAGIEYGVEVINGIEINADYDGEMHILGFFIHEQNEKLVSCVREMKDFRAVRNAKMIKAMADLGFPITNEEVCALKDGGTLFNIGRIHMARLLVEKGCFPDVQTVFRDYLGTNCPAYYAKQRFSPKECINIIHASGGLAFLAHPIFIAEEEKKLRALLISLKSIGLDGVECLYSSHPPAYQKLCESICSKLSLLKSGGSDFHAKNKPHIAIGRVYQNSPIPYKILQDIKDFHDNLL